MSAAVWVILIALTFLAIDALVRGPRRDDH